MLLEASVKPVSACPECLGSGSAAEHLIIAFNDILGTDAESPNIGGTPSSVCHRGSAKLPNIQFVITAILYQSRYFAAQKGITKINIL
jgi:hypothetical protein